MGPTAAGKTAIALRLAERGCFGIVSVDSAMVYRGMDIGTAKPDPQCRARVPHALVDICAPDSPYSAARFRRDALAAIDRIVAAGKIPLLVGGTGLYFRALGRGLSALPAADSAVRADLQRHLRAEGLGALHRRLQRVDPGAAARIHPNDTQRVLRALEVFELTGRPLSQLQGRAGGGREGIVRIVLAPADRGELHERIAVRFERMLAAGLVEELAGLRARYRLDASLPSMRAVGYRQAWLHLEAALDADSLRERGVIATRQLAKRQLTWFRREPGAVWVDAAAPDAEARTVDALAAARVL